MDFVNKELNYKKNKQLTLKERETLENIAVLYSKL